jgi:hypothetical protein
MWTRRIGELFAWAAPAAALTLVPKCPACLAAYVALWTGIGLSFTAAAYLRWTILGVSIVSLAVLVALRFAPARGKRDREKKDSCQCNTKS